MYRIVYVSTATNPLSATECDRLLERAQQRNATSGLTGALLIYGGHYLQVLEGPRAAVEATFERIGADPRHVRIVVVERADAQAPEFERWSMIRVDVGPTADRAVDAFLRSLATRPDAAKARSAVALLAALARRAAARLEGRATEPGALEAIVRAGTDPLTPPSRA